MLNSVPEDRIVDERDKASVKSACVGDYMEGRGCECEVAHLLFWVR